MRNPPCKVEELQALRDKVAQMPEGDAKDAKMADLKKEESMALQRCRAIPDGKRPGHWLAMVEFTNPYNNKMEEKRMDVVLCRTETTPAQQHSVVQTQLIQDFTNATKDLLSEQQMQAFLAMLRCDHSEGTPTSTLEAPPTRKQMSVEWEKYGAMPDSTEEEKATKKGAKQVPSLIMCGTLYCAHTYCTNHLRCCVALS